MATKIREEKYIKSDSRKNNNKFWVAEVYDDGSFTALYGRVGDPGKRTSPKNFGSVSAANAYADKKIKEKTRDGRNGEIAYRKIEIVGEGASSKVTTSNVSNNKLESIAKKQIKFTNPNVEKLISYLTKVNAHQISLATGGQITYSDTTGLFSTPLGIVTQDNIDNANDILVKIGDYVAKNRYTEKLVDLTNDYLMLVPQDIGRHRLDVNSFWCDLTKVQTQKQIVDSLQASLVIATTKPTTKNTVKVKEEKIFDVQLDLVDDSNTIDRITKMYRDTRQSMHSCKHLDVKTIYSVDINTVRRDFEEDGAKDENIWELWHGSRCSNLLSILKGGLVMPTASSNNVTGKMFSGHPGKEGLYFSDQSSKSLNYSFGYWSGNRDNNCFMFLVDVAMGKYYVPKGPHDGPFPKKGYDSTFAKANKSQVHNNEMIVYSTSKINLKYLIEFSPNGK